MRTRMMLCFHIIKQWINKLKLCWAIVSTQISTALFLHHSWWYHIQLPIRLYCYYHYQFSTRYSSDSHHDTCSISWCARHLPERRQWVEGNLDSNKTLTSLWMKQPCVLSLNNVSYGKSVMPSNLSLVSLVHIVYQGKAQSACNPCW